MRFTSLAQSLQKLEATSSRIATTKILSEIFIRSDAGEIGRVTNLILGRLAPGYKGIVFNMADKMVIKALARAAGESEEKIKADYKRHGDLGIVAEKHIGKKDSKLAVSGVYDKLYKLAVDEGEGSQERKIIALSELFSGASPLGARYLARIPLGKLRLGASDKTIIDALSWMEKGDKSASPEIEAAYQVMPDAGAIAEMVKKNGVEGLSRKVTPQVGTPTLPMLSQRLKSPFDMIEKMGRVSVEPKFDGLRVLIHFDSGLTRAFSRNLNEVSSMFPELQRLGDYTKAKELILDSEAIGFDSNKKKFLDFQMTMTRRRKHEVAKAVTDTPMQFQVFDVIYKDGKNLMGEPYIKRRKVLERLFKKNPVFLVDENTVTRNPEVIIKMHKSYKDKGLEGVMVKKADSKYVPGRTGWRWVKMKEAQSARAPLSDTVDAVIMGFTAGRGRRAGFGVGQFLAGVRNGNSYLTVTKVGTGLSDEEFRALNKRLGLIKAAKKPGEYRVHKDLEPDFWVEPEVVVELAADEITRSPKHTAGLALRFPRFVRFRDDKSPSLATTLSELKELYKLQKNPL